MTPEEAFRAAERHIAETEPFDVEAGWARLVASMAPDNWDQLTPAEQEEHVRLLHSLPEDT